MSKQFYCIYGIDDVNLKQAFLNSFPKPLGAEAQKILTVQRGTLQASTLAQLYELIVNALECLCNQKKFMAHVEKTNRQLADACDKRYLNIKCKEKTCDCSSKKRNHVRQHDKASPSYKKFSPRRKWRKIVKKKKFRGKKSNFKCFICQKP